MLKRFLIYLKILTFTELIDFIRLKFVLPKIRIFQGVTNLFDSHNGLEIGGPSPIFGRKSKMPIYALATSIDGVNFSDRTLWEGEINTESGYSFEGRPLGKQYICDAVELIDIGDESYDFIISSNSLEHVANPLRALREWFRVLKTEGAILIAVPNKRANFDRNRSVSKLSELITAFEEGLDESDISRLEEVVLNHDLALDPDVLSREALRLRCEANMENRAMHQHVYDQDLLEKVLKWTGFDVLHLESDILNHYAIAKKVEALVLN